MKKKLICLFMSFILLFQTGCWSYRGLNELTIVAGVAVDWNPDTSEYLLTFEIIDMNRSNKDEGIKSTLIDSRGKTMIEAVRNAKRRLTNKLYFGNAELVVIGNKVAEKKGLENVVNWFMMDARCRETMTLVVSQEKTAREILAANPLDGSVISFEISDIASEDSKDVSSTYYLPLYKIYTQLQTAGISTSAPAVHLVMNNGKKVVETNGQAVFYKDLLVGYLSPEECRSLLFSLGKAQGGVLSVYVNGNEAADVGLEIASNKSKLSVKEENGKLNFQIESEIKVYLDESKVQTDLMSEQMIKDIETKAGRMVKTEILTTFKRTQQELKTDVWGFGSHIHQYHPKLWKDLKADWDNQFQTVNLTVNVKVMILNTAFIKKS